jgi:hypothetical protein
METRAHHRIGDLKRTIGKWIAMDPGKITFENGTSLYNERNIWGAVFNGNIEFTVGFGNEILNIRRYEDIYFQAKRLIFKENDLKLQMVLHEDLMIRSIKKIILLKLKVTDSLIKFLLNEKLFNHRSRISDLLKSTELIGIMIFKIQDKI